MQREFSERIEKWGKHGEEGGKKSGGEKTK